MPKRRLKVRKPQLIAVLNSSAAENEKADACMQLARVGTKAAVRPLAALLGDDKLSHMARYALEPIPDASVDQALRQEAGKLEGRKLVGLIGSIGVRRDMKAFDLLRERLKDHDAGGRAGGRTRHGAARFGRRSQGP